MHEPDISQLFLSGLGLVYEAHQQGARQAAQNESTSSLPALKRAVKLGSKQNLKQAKRLEKVFESVSHPAVGHPDPVMQGIVDGNNHLIAKTASPDERDLINIASGQLAAHYYLATYGTLRNYAKALGNRRAARLLSKTLNETSTIDKKFTVLANAVIARSKSKNTSTHSTRTRSNGSLLPASLAAAGAIGLYVVLNKVNQS